MGSAEARGVNDIHPSVYVLWIEAVEERDCIISEKYEEKDPTRSRTNVQVQVYHIKLLQL